MLPSVVLIRTADGLGSIRADNPAGLQPGRFGDSDQAQKVTVTVSRSGEDRIVQIILGELPGS